MKVKQQFFSVKEVAKILGLHEKTIQKYIYETGELKAVRIGGTTKVSKDEINNFIVPFERRK